MSDFRKENGFLDREYLRACGLYRLTRMRRLSREACIELSNKPMRKSYTRKPDWLVKTIDIWFRGPFREWA